jgi:hypothetical protein
MTNIKKIIKDIKKAEFHADFESVEKVVKKCTKKVISKKSLTNMSKKWKRAFFRHIFANIFLMVHFFKGFSTDSKSAWNSAFYDTHLEILNKNFFALISTFCKLWLQMRRKWLKKTGIFFSECVLEFIRQPSKGLHIQVVKIVVPYCTCSLGGRWCFSARVAAQCFSSPNHRRPQILPATIRAVFSRSCKTADKF